jgi:tRNA (cmo5U34)-methyltransferase
VGRNRQKLAIPKEWTFRTPAVAKAFDSHVREQLPWYDLATGVVAHVARSYIRDDGFVIDVGASTGNIGRALRATLATRRADLVAIDSQDSMKGVYDAPGIFQVADAVTFDFTSFQRRGKTRNPDVIVCFLSMMFVPVLAAPA